MNKKFRYSDGARQKVGRIRAALFERQIFGCEIEPDKNAACFFRVIRQADGACIAGPGTLERVLQEVKRL